MYTNRKQQSNYYSQPKLNDGTYMVPQPFSRISQQITPRPQLQREIPMIKRLKQTSFVLTNPPYQNDSQLVPYNNNQEQTSNMQDYIASIYGKRIEKSLNPQYSQSMLRQKNRLQKIVLPRILRSHQKCVKDREREEIKIMRNLEDRYQRLQPQMQMVYNQARQNHQMNQKQYQQKLHQYLKQQQQFNGCQQCAMQNRGEDNVHHKHKNYPKNDNIQPKTQQKISKIAKKPRVSPQRRKRLLSKFRIYGYAVFFAVIFPDYSYLFAHYKLKQFLSKYLIDNNTYIRKMSSKLQQKFKQIPLYESIRSIHQQYENENFNVTNNNNSRAVRFSEQPKIKLSSEATDENYVINLNVFKNIIGMMLKSYMNIVDDLDDDQLQFLSVGVLNTSYYGDQIYSIEELAFINYHQQKGNIKVSKKQQRALLISNFIIKRVIYQYLIRLAVDPDWHEEMASLSTLKPHEVEFFKIVCKEIQLAAYFFYEIAIKNFYLLIDPQKQGNFIGLNDSAMPLPLKTMKFPNLFMTNEEKQIFRSQFEYYLTRNDSPYKRINKHKNKNISQGTIQKFNSKYDWKANENQIFEQYTELIEDNPLNLIHNSSQFDELSPIISQFMKSSYDKIQHSLMKIVDKLYKKVTEKKRKNYRQYHNNVIKTKYILTKQHDILQGIAFLRNQEQKKIVAMSKRMLEIYIENLEDYEFQQKDKVNKLSSNKYLSTSKNKNTSKESFSLKKIGSQVSIRLQQSSKHESFDSDRNKSNYKSTRVPFRRKR